ncbi:MAG: proton-conducting transporter membrane subunit [Methanolinea sp.]|jgi:multicomponent Na+:H+ antiporter subunit D|nr:NADH:ubiquinone oxidoreductase [Methanolinea sp.]
MILEFVWTHAPALLVAIPLLGAFLCPVIGKISRTTRTAWVAGIMLVSAIVAFILASRVLTEGTVLYSFGAFDPTLTIPMDSGGIPIRIIFTVDAMSAFMDIICATVGFSAIAYSLSAESRNSGLEGYYTLFLLMVCGVFGMVSTGDFFNFFVFLEILSMASAGIIAYRVDGGVAVEAAIKYFVLSSVGAIFVLFAIGIYYGQYDALNMAVIASRIQWSTLDMIALVMLVAALAMKCGAVPMHFWTPDAYSMAPSSATAFLVVASQASLYGLFRVLFTFYNVTLNAATMGWIIIILGVLSMVVGVTMAIPQKDVKRLMAYHAVSQTGYMLLGVGVGLAVLGNQPLMESFGYMAMSGGVFHILNHALYKGLLFLTAGAIFYRIGTRNLNKMGGLGHNMKWTMIFFIIGALAIAGIPPLNGFASKLMIYESVFIFNPVLAIIAMVVSILTLASFVKVFHSIFMGPQLPEYAGVKEAPPSMLLGMGILASLAVIFGLFPDLVVTTLVNPAVHALTDQGAYIASVLGGA